MNNGLYSAFLGMRARQRTLESQANNIANALTGGFKAERLLYSTVEASNKGSTSRQNVVAGAMTTGQTDFSAGPINQTGRSLDLAIEGDAFLQIQTERGVRYTRAGNLSLDASGQLVTKNNDLVVGEKGAITVPAGGEITIGADGTLAVDGERFERLKLVRFENPVTALVKEGATLFAETGSEPPLEATNSRIYQGALESSNINSINEMVAMMNNTREFDSLQKSVSLLMNDLGRKIAGEIGKL